MTGSNPHKEYYFSGTRWEPIVGYARAIRVGEFILVSGTTSTDEQGEVLYPGDAYQQTVQVIKNIEKALKALNASLQDVVRTRIYVTDISLWEEIGQAHGKFFRDVCPATTMVEVRRLIHPDMLVEMEAMAIAR